MPTPRELFLSHSSEDQVFAESLANVLRQHSIPVWFSRTHIVGATQWHDEIGEALKRCDWFAVVLSPSAVESMWVKRELLYVLQQGRYEDKIIPIIKEACDYERLSWVLDSFQMIDCSESYESGCRELLRIWRINYEIS